MQRKIIIENKEYQMPKVSVDTYTKYLEFAEQIDEATGSRKSQRYSKQEIDIMVLFICEVYGNQFTPEQLKNCDTGLDAAGIILEFTTLDLYIAEEINKRMEKIQQNFQSGK